MIQRQITTKNEKTLRIEKKWKKYKEVWASVNNKSGKEMWSKEEWKGTNILEVVIRYNACPTLSLSDRIIFGDRVFNIIYIDNYFYKNETLKITVEEVI